MFGTLNCNIQQKEPLTFVPTIDPATALNRSQRDKPHVSCESCRKRKIRCDGNPSGCDKCIASSARCQYADRDSRRKRRPTSRQENLGSGSKSSFAGLTSPRQPLDSQNLPEKISSNTAARDEIVSAPATEQSAINSPSDHLNNLFGMDLDQQDNQHQMERWLLSSLVDTSNSSTLDSAIAFDMDSNMTPMLQDQLDIGGSPDDVDDAMGESLFGTSDRSSGNFDGFDTTPSSDSLPDSDCFNYSSLLEDMTSFANLPPLPSYQSELNTGRKLSSATDSRSSPTSMSPAWRSQPNSSNLYSQRKSPASETAKSQHKSRSDLPSNSSERSDSSCRCLHSIARLLEELGARSASREPVSMDVLLGYLRGALADSATALDCKQCMSLSEHNMLLAMAGQYMSRICERIVACYISLRRAQEHEPKRSTRTSSTDSSVSGGLLKQNPSLASVSSHLDGASVSNSDEMWFSTYRIESGKERMQVIRCLVMIQIKELSRLLEMLRARAGSRMGPLVPLLEASKKVKMMKAMLNSNRM